MNFEQIRNNQTQQLLKCISGSRAYGLNTPQSDTDIKGVYVLPKTEFYSLSFADQLSNESNDEVFYELRRFIELLSINNPNILELLSTPDDCILYRHPLMEMIRPDFFLSRLCMNTFAGYAQSQVKKAKGLNKKIVNPVEKERKTITDFCYVVKGQGTITLKTWLKEKNFKQEECGLVNVPHMRDVYSVYHASQLQEGFFRGISSGEEANDVSLSSVPAGIEPVGIMSFNKDGYSKYCKDYRNYWNWVDNRNEVRYENTVEHGKNYDAKNMMHTFRLLAMSEEIALYKEVRVRRTDREFLLKIKKGEFQYEDLVKLANEKTENIKDLFEKSDLPDSPDLKKCNDLLIEMRERFYGEK